MGPRTVREERQPLEKTTPCLIAQGRRHVEPVQRDERGRALLDHGGIVLFELSQFASVEVETEEQRWLRFFKDGEQLDAERLPAWMQTTQMRQAMSTLKTFSEKARADHADLARQDDLRAQASMARRQQELEEALAKERVARDVPLLEIEAKREAKEAALAEIARLRALQRDGGGAQGNT